MNPASNTRAAAQASTHLQLAAQLLADDQGSAFPLLSARDLASYDIGKLFRAAIDPAKRKEALLELDVDTRAVQLEMSTGRGMFVPWAVLTRDFNAGTSTQAGNLIATRKSRDVAAWLRPVTACVRAGATVLPDLKGTMIMPKISTGASAAVVAEAASIGESTPAIDGLTLTPHFISGYVELSRQYDIQSPELAGVIMSDLRLAIGSVLDQVALNGTGSGEPLGVLNDPGIGDLALGDNGGYLTWLDVTKLEQIVDEAAGEVGSEAFVTSPAIKRGLRQFGANGESPVWQKAGGRDFLGGAPATVSTNVPTDLTKGTSSDCSPLIYGRWSEMFIGLYGAGVEFVVDRVTLADRGMVRITACLLAGAGIRRKGCFAAIKDSRIPA